MATLYITNKYGASVFGVLTLSVTVLSIFSLIPNFGMSSAIVRIIGELKVHEKFEEIKHSIIIIFIFTIATSVLFVLLLNFSSHFISDQILNKMYMAEYLINISPAIISSTVLVVISTTFQSLQEVKKYIFFQTILHQLLFLIFLIINYSFYYHATVVEVFVYSNILSALVAFVFFIVKILAFPKSEKKKSHEFGFFKIVQISSPMLFSTSLLMIMSWTDILMIGIFETEADVGIYSAAIRMASLISMSLMAVNVIATPKFIEFYAKKDMENLEAIAKQSTKLICLMSFPLFGLYIIFPENIMEMFGDEFIAGAGVLVVLSVGQLVNAISGPVGNILQMTDNQTYFQNTILISTLINFGLNYFLIPLYGIVGASYATLISMALWNIALVFVIRIKLGFWTISSFSNNKI